MGSATSNIDIGYIGGGITNPQIEKNGDNHKKRKKKKITNFDEPSHVQLDLKGVQARVDFIHVDGLGRTKESLIEPILRELFQSENFQEICQNTHHARIKMQQLGCFKDIKIIIDTSEGPNATPNGYDITFKVKEQSRLVGGVNTLVGNNEASLALGLKVPNLLGSGELVNAEYSYGSKRSSNFNLAASRPYFCKIPFLLTTSIFQQGSVWPTSGYRQMEQGGLVDFTFMSTPVLKHNLQWEVSLREIASLSSETAFQVREVTGPDLKSSIRHIMSLDERDLPIFPTCGHLVRMYNELAGLGGDVGFIKNELKLEYNYSFYENIVLQGTFSTGHIRQFQDEKNIGISDQFYLGGPLSLRGFEMRGVGPKSEENTLGSDVYWLGGLHLFLPLPYDIGDTGISNLFRGHLFMNIGNLNKAVGEFKLLEGTRMALGAGFALRLGQAAKLELNYCLPYYFQESDRAVEGFQFGIGVDFS